MSILKKTDKDAHKAIKWVAAEYEYLKELEADLDEMKRDINNLEKERKDSELAERLLEQIGRCERKAKRYEKRLDEDLKELLNQVPSSLKPEGVNIEKNLKIAIDSILKNTSRYVGELKDNVKGLEVQIDLLEMYRSNRFQQQAIHNRINEIVSELKNKVSGIIKWVSSLAVDLEQAEKFEMKLAT